MKAKLKLRLWVWLHCKKIGEKLWVCRRYTGQVMLMPSLFKLAGQLVEVRLTDKNALGDPSDAAFLLMEGLHPFWIPNWFIAEVWDD